VAAGVGVAAGAPYEAPHRSTTLFGSGFPSAFWSVATTAQRGFAALLKFHH
jgi:hypothetical protein